MRVVIVSDLHIGPDGVPAVYAGHGKLPPAIEAQRPDLVILNGDSFDLLLEGGALDVAPAAATARFARCIDSAHGRELLGCLAGVLAGGGEVWVRPGNHDLELAVPEVQACLTERMAAIAGPAVERLRFKDAAEPLRLDVGGLNVLVTHGEHDDAWNQWRAVDVVQAAAGGGAFTYPPGSLLVKDIMNPVKRELPFIDLLKPDFRGAVLTAMAVDPKVARAVLTPSTLKVMRQVVDNLVSGSLFAASGEQPEPGFVEWNEILGDAGLDQPELDELRVLVGDGSEGAPFGFSPSAFFSRLLDKLARVGLRAYARAQRWAVGGSGERFFHEEPEEKELAGARRLGREWSCDVVIAGHTHARRWHISPDLTYMNTGTWMWLMRLPDPEASLDEWSAFLGDLRRDRAGTAYRELRGAICVIDPAVTDRPVRLVYVDAPPAAG